MTNDKPIGFAMLLARIEVLEKRVRALEHGGRHPERDRARSFSQMIAEAQQEENGGCCQ